MVLLQIDLLFGLIEFFQEILVSLQAKTLIFCGLKEKLSIREA